MRWSELLPKPALDTASSLEQWVQQERDRGIDICPPQDQIFRALNLTPPEKTKVVIMGQDPYHTPNTANGLAFSCNGSPAPSLNNIFRELASDVGCAKPSTGDLTPWASQGVLLLNATLTVYEHQANSHSKLGWQGFTKAILKAAAQLPQPIVFVLWGANAQDLKDDIIQSLAVYKPGGVILQDKIKKDIIMSSHPSPFSASKPCRDTPAFLGSKPFSKVNSLLIARGSAPVDWELH